ncbi:MAG: alkene reductase [Candidatus Lokiarchaeota archaeon]|nr:alkene reductase [Candidatus Lokiarchaeota archaeon]
MKLNNRIVMAPMTRSRADNPDNCPNELMVEYYKQRSTAGLIITEGSPVSKRAIGSINVPGIFTQKQVDGWKKITRVVHDNGGKIFLQLWHVGRMSHPDVLDGQAPLAPSAINPKTPIFTSEKYIDSVTPLEMTLEDIKQTAQDFKNGAKNALEAGFDGVEVHSSNGYLFHQFFTRCSNTRTDQYGGSIENRARFLFEVLDEIKTSVPEQKIGVRLNPSFNGFFGISVDEETIPTFDYIVNRLNDYDLAYLHLSEPFNDVSNVPHAEQHVAKRYRPIYKGTLMINAHFTRETGNKVIEDKLADLVAFGKLFISNPDLPRRFELKAELARWDKETFYNKGKFGYTDYPKLDD